MKKILRLANVMTKDILQGSTSTKKKQTPLNKFLIVIGISLLFLFLSITMYFLSKDLLESLIQINRVNSVFDIIFVSASFFIFIISILTLPSIFYFSKDVENLLALPLEPYEILAAKTLATYFNLLLSISFILLPFGIAYQFIVNPPLTFFLFYLLTFVILPIIPLALSITIIVLLFSFIPKIKNKNLFTYITSLGTIAIILYINLQSAGDPDILNQIILSDGPLTSFIGSMIPTIGFLAKGISQNNILWILLSLILSLAFIVIVINLIEKLYFKGAIASGEHSKNKKHKKRKRTVKNQSKILSSKIYTVIKYDIKNIFRTPTFAINYLLPLAILPGFMFITLFSVYSSGDIEPAMVNELLVVLQEGIQSLNFKTIFPYIVISSFAITYFTGSLSTLTSTSISREGEQMLNFKTMPISLLIIIKAKLILGIIVSIILPLVALLTLTFLFKLEFIVVGVSLITVIITAVLSNLLNILLDLYKPKLVWDNEVQAVKQNFLTVIPILGSFMILGFIIFIFATTSAKTLLSIVLLVISTLLIVLIYEFLIKRSALKMLNVRIEDL